MAVTNNPFDEIDKPGGAINQNKNSDGLLTTRRQITVPDKPAITPGNADWGRGDLKVNSKGAYFTPSDSGFPGDNESATAAPAQGPLTEGQRNLSDASPWQKDSVAGQLNGLLASNSPYINAARASSERAMNARGLLNSTMAGTAGEKAAIESALPIAQQDAGYRQDINKIDRQIDKEADAQSRLQEEQGKIQKGLYETQGEISERLAKQGFTHDMALKKADLEFQKLDLTSRLDLEREKISENNKSMFESSVQQIGQDYQDKYLAILADPAFETPEDRQAAIDVLNRATRDRYEVAAQVAKIELDWGSTENFNPKDVKEEKKKQEEAKAAEEAKKEEEAKSKRWVPNPEGRPNNNWSR